LLIAPIRRELSAIDPTVAVDHVKTLQEVRRESIAAQTFVMQLLLGFSIGGCVLALVGIYGVLSLSVGSRTREIAIRMAIGAQRGQVVSLILREGLKIVVVGLVVGLGCAVALCRVLKALLFGVQPVDFLTFVCVAIFFLTVAMLACFIPARRAANTDPAQALRHD
jgi:putative ABC transport system permease protein